MEESDLYLTKTANRIRKRYGLSALFASMFIFIVPFFLNSILLYYIGGILFLTPVFASFVAKRLPKEKVNPDGKAVFITGCDSGFGHLLAQRLDDLGFQVFAGCLFPDGDGAVKLRKSVSSRLHVISLDVTNDDSVLKAAKYVQQNLKENVLWAVVNNAGINAGADIHWTDLDIIKRVMEVNTFGTIRVTKALLPKLKQSKGRIVTLASAAGRFAWPGIVSYCMSKTAAIAFCDGLRLEMYKWGIQVVTIEPWFHKTPIASEEAVEKNIRQTWESVPNDVKDLYSTNYIENYTRNAVGILRKISLRNPNEVVSIIQDAVTCLYPEYSYASGSVAVKLGTWILKTLPKPIFDKYIFDSIMEKGIR